MTCDRVTSDNQMAATTPTHADTKPAAFALGTERIRKLLVQYAVPAIIAMTATSLYNMVDSIFIGQGVGPLAISGLALTFPLMNLSAAFGAMVGVGAATLISMRLGQRDYATAQNVLGNVLTLNTIIGVAFAVQLIVEVTGRDFIAVPNLLVDVAIKADGSQDSHLLQRPQQQLLR